MFKSSAFWLLVLAIAAFIAVKESAPPALAQPLANVTAFSQDWAVVTPGATLTRQPRGIILCDDEDVQTNAYVVDLVPWQGSTATPIVVLEGAVYPLSPKLIEADDTTAPCIVALY